MTSAFEELELRLKEQEKEDILELIEDAKSGHLEEIELVESIGLLYNKADNKQLIDWFQSKGVHLIYVKDDE